MEQQLIDFAREHWLLVAAFLAVLLVIIGYELYMLKNGLPRISPQQAILLLNREDAVVIDLRDSSAYKNGHIVGAKNITNKELSTHLDKLEKYKEKPIILSCAMGQHSSAMAEQLRKQGFKNVNIIMGGVANWQSAGFPLVK